jgi:ankyrin repeat protein
VKLLLKAGADATVTDADGKTADQLTSSEKARKLITKAINYRKAELHLCEQVMTGNMDLLHKNMKSPRFNPNMLDGENKLSLLMLVCAHGDADTVTRLIKAGANPNFVSTDSRSVLHKAILRNDAGIIKALLDGGADPMLRAGNQAVALHDAVWERKHESIKALLPAYKDINYSPAGGFNGTPINLAIDRNFADVVQLFIDAGINLNDNKNGDLPLVHAAIAGKAKCIEVLLKAGADKNARDKNGKTAKEAAAESVRHLL